MSVIRTGLPILVELIDLVNSVIIFLSQMTLLRWLMLLLGCQAVILILLLFWIYFFLLMLVLVLQWLSLHWKIPIMLLSQFPVTFHQTHNGMSRFVAELHSSNTPPFKGGGEGVNFHYLPRRGESEILKKGWKYGAGASLLQKGGGLTLFLFNCFKFYHFYI